MSDDLAPAIEAEGTATPMPEAAPEAAPETPAEPPPNRRLIEAARIERRVRAERMAADKARIEAAEQAKQIAAFRSQYDEMRQKVEQFESVRQTARKNPKALLAEVGLDLDTIVRAHLEDGPTTESLIEDVGNRTKSEVEALRAELMEIKRREEAREAQAQQAQSAHAANALRAEIQSVITSNPEKYELTSMLGQEGEVFELMRLAYQHDGTVLPVDRAADAIESYLLDQAKQAAKAKKLAALFMPQEPKAAPQAKPTDAREPKASATLTSKLATSPAQPEAEEMLDRDTALDLIAKKIKAKREARASK